MSFDIALSGIQAINQQLESISNNIANAGTFGFKSSRANFSSLYSGSNPTGSHIGSVTQNIGQGGGALNTGRGLDALINGNGYFASVDSRGQMNYSRVGIFEVDAKGFLTDASGRNVQGYPIQPGSTLPGPMGSLQVPNGQIPAQASTTLSYVGNMSADWTPPAVTPFNPAVTGSYNYSKVAQAYDSLGGQHTVTQYFVAGGNGTVTAHYTIDGQNATPATAPVLTFGTNGQLTAVNNAAPAPVALLPITPSNGAAALTLSVDYTGSTAFAGTAPPTTNQFDGYASGIYQGVTLGSDGTLVAQYSNGKKQTVGQLALATFANDNGLSPSGETSWVASSTSGVPLYGPPGVGMAGALSVAALEQSNVDITSELVGLMTSQRNYQANSKVISTESAMLQSLMQAL